VQAHATAASVHDIKIIFILFHFPDLSFKIVNKCF